MSRLAQMLRKRSLSLLIVLAGVELAALVHWKYQSDIKTAREHYRHESHAQSEAVAYNVERVFRSMYQGIRTIALLPGVRSIDRYGKNFDANARQTTQELYNNLASNVAMSEVYIVPLEMQPDTMDAHTHKLQEPITTFDQLIVGHHADQKEGKKEADLEVKTPEIEIYEYRLMRKQLDWFRQHYPREEDIKGLEFPALCGREVITCDNSHYSPSHPNDEDRSGLVYSVPFYGKNGRLRGCISGIILTHALRDLLPTGSYALRNRSNAYTAPPNEPGTWQTSARWIVSAQSDPSLLYSEARKLQVRDGDNQWILWAGLPDKLFWSRSEVQSARRFALIGYLATATLFAALSVIAGLVRRHQRDMEAKNAELEVRVKQRTEELEAANEKLQALATTDGMTGLANHRTFQEKLHEAAAHAKTEKSALALLLMDVDKFKQYNDTFGHPAGDQVLKTLAKLLHECVGTGDLVARCIARYGGEEFAVILTDDAADRAPGVAERIRAHVEQHNFEYREVTLSIGVVVYMAELTPELLVTHADKALYAAKHGGRNRIVLADSARGEIAPTPPASLSKAA